MTHHVSIIGGGASGVLTAMNLLAQPDSEDVVVTIHERSGTLARGVAYGTDDRRHLLNVRARLMSAFPLVPHDFLEWAQRRGPVDPQAFLPRADFALYLQERLAAVADHRLEVRTAEVVDVVPTGPDRFEVRSEDGRTHASSVVLAVGHDTPRDLTADGTPLPPASWHVADPWTPGLGQRVGRNADVLLVGSGLTAVDAALTLLGDDPGCRVTLLSRSGQLPRRHIERQHSAWVTTVPEGDLRADDVAALVQEQFEAARAQGLDWRVVVDGLRAATPKIWQRLPLEERQRFLATYARDWEVRRHRMAPEVAAAVTRHRSRGRLRVMRGTLTKVVDHGATCSVELDGVTETFDAVVNCTGPSTDLALAPNPLLRSMRLRGTVSADPLALGLATTPTGGALDVDGHVVPNLYVVGPALKASLWEATAIPEIRQQAARVAADVVRRATDGTHGNEFVETERIEAYVL